VKHLGFGASIMQAFRDGCSHRNGALVPNVTAKKTHPQYSRREKLLSQSPRETSCQVSANTSSEWPGAQSFSCRTCLPLGQQEGFLLSATLPHQASIFTLWEPSPFWGSSVVQEDQGQRTRLKSLCRAQKDGYNGWCTRFLKIGTLGILDQ
jgi:hypothetical protein